MKLKLLIVILFTIIYSLLTAEANAQTVVTKPVYPPDQGNLYERLIGESSYKNDPVYVDGNVRKVNISFKELAGDNDEYGLCPLSEQEACTNFKIVVPIKASNGEIQATVCGAGKDALKGRISSGTNITGKDCSDTKDYFHEGHIYRLGIYDNKKAEGLMALAEFYVKHSMPWVHVNQKEKGATTIDVALWGRRPGGDDKNNYQIVIEGVDNNLKGEECVTVKDTFPTFPAGYQKDPKNPLGRQGTTKSVGQKIFGKQTAVPFPPGRYVVKINEGTHEGGFLGTGIGYKCNGGFTYMHIPLKIVTNQSECKATDKSKCGNIVGKIEFDPNESDAAKEFDLFAGARATCADYDPVNNTCNKVNTALGGIDTTPAGFIKTIFQFVLVLAAFGAIIIIIYSGYMLITSAGNKERIAAARETITSAVVGLLFIIFSLVILEILGVDILRIPGLAR